MQGIEIRLKEEAVRDAILTALASSGLQATDETTVKFVSAPGEPIVVAVSELKMGPARPVAAPPQPTVDAAPPKPVTRAAPRLVQAQGTKVNDVESALFGGQPAWPGAKPYLPDTEGKIAMPDAGKHEDGQLDDDAVVSFDASRFAVAPVPEGESPSTRAGSRRAYEAPDESDDVPDAYRAGPPPEEE